MDLRPKKLTAAYAALLDVLAHGRSMAVASAVALTREIADVSERTIYAARARLPITCDREGDGPGWWRLTDGDTSPPEEWKRRKLRFCRVCGEPMPETAWNRKRCQGCGGSKSISRARS